MARESERERERAERKRTELKSTWMLCIKLESSGRDTIGSAAKVSASTHSSRSFCDDARNSHTFREFEVILNEKSDALFDLATEEPFSAMICGGPLRLLPSSIPPTLSLALSLSFSVLLSLCLLSSL